MVNSIKSEKKVVTLVKKKVVTLVGISNVHVHVHVPVYLMCMGTAGVGKWHSYLNIFLFKEVRVSNCNSLTLRVFSIFITDPSNVIIPYISLNRI